MNEILKNLLGDHQPGDVGLDVINEYVDGVYEVGCRVLAKNGRGNYLNPPPTSEDVLNSLDHFDLAGAFAKLGIKSINQFSIENTRAEFQKALAEYPFEYSGKRLGQKVGKMPDKLFEVLKQSVLPLAIKEIACQVHDTPTKKRETVEKNLRDIFGQLASIEMLCAALVKNITPKLEFASIMNKDLDEKLTNLKWSVLGHLSTSKEPADPDQIRMLLEENKSPASSFSVLFGLLLVDVNQGNLPLSALDDVLKEVRVFDYLTVGEDEIYETKE